MNIENQILLTEMEKDSNLREIEVNSQSHFDKIYKDELDKRKAIRIQMGMAGSEHNHKFRPITRKRSDYLKLKN